MTSSLPCPNDDCLLGMLDGTLAQDRQAEVEDHVGGCPDCQRRLEGLLSPELGEDLSWDNVVEALHASAAEPDAALGEAIARLKVRREDSEKKDRDWQCAAALACLSPSDDLNMLGRLGPYEIAEVIGYGGMGVVFKGYDGKLNRVVAIKVLAPALASNATARKRFLREAQAAAAVGHLHVVTIFAVDEDRLPYLVMEYINGQSLQQKIDCEGHLELKETLRIGMQIASGLAAAHAQGLIHRDIKPSNVLLENGVQRVRITDFGLARAVDDVGMTKTGEVAGTPQYMSPEQAQGLTIDARADLFSLGCVLYAMCTGRSPFRAETTIGAIRRVCDDRPRLIREINPETPPWLVEIVDRLLEKRPEDRIQSAAEVAERLGGHLAHVQDPDSTPPPGPLPGHRPHRRPRRRRWLAIAVALFAAIGGLAATEATGLTHFTASIIRVVTGEGTLVIEVDDPGVSVTIDGRDLVITGAGPKEVRLQPGQYEVRAAKDGEPVKTELVTITRGERKVVRVFYEPAPPARRIGEVLRFEEHSWHVWDVAFSPDGRHVLSAGGPDVLLWDVKTGAVERRYGGHGHPNVDGALNVAFSPDGGRFFTAAADGSVRIWDLQTGELVRRFDGQPGWVSFALSRDGHRMVSAGMDHTARIWDVQTGEELLRFTSHTSGIHSVALAPDGRRALSADHDRVVLYWDTESGEVLRRFEECNGNVAFHPDGRHALIGVMQSVVLLDLETGREVRRFHGHSEPVKYMVFSPDGRRALSTAGDLSIRLWDVESGEQLACFEGHTDQPTALAFSPDGRFALSGSQRLDASVRVWALPTAKPAPARPKESDL